MILFINIGLYDTIIHHASYNRENAKNYDKMDVFKYSLASYVHFYKWSKVIIYYQLSDAYISREQELQNFIEEEFKGFNLITRNYRNEKPSQWQETYELLDDNLVFYSCNHDHVFFDPDPTYIADILEDFKDNNELIILPWSHWQENLSHAWSSETYHHPLKELKILDKYLTYKVAFDINSISIINKRTYHYWWFTYDLPEQNFMRPDHPTDPIWHYGEYQSHTNIVPYREMGRHFDGYQHCAWKFLNRFCPVLEIPEGFFDYNIKINYSTKYIDGKTNINPLNDNLRIFSNSGSDFNMHKKYIPLFWKKRISEFVNNFSNSQFLDIDSIHKEIHVERVLNSWSGMSCRDLEIKKIVDSKILEYHNKI